MVAWSAGAVGLHVAHRSAYSPPSAGDLYFRDAVGVAPNPELEAERVPGEIEAGASVRAAPGGWAASLRAAAYRGAIDGMILWAPDYRFVWSPYNQDAKRLGANLSFELVSPARRLRVAGGWSAVRIRYDRGPEDDDVQIAYRPRHTASLEGGLTRGPTRNSATLRYIGERTTAPTALNTLPGFWTMDGVVGHELALRGWLLGLDLRV